MADIRATFIPYINECDYTNYTLCIHNHTTNHHTTNHTTNHTNHHAYHRHMIQFLLMLQKLYPIILPLFTVLSLIGAVAILVIMSSANRNRQSYAIYFRLLVTVDFIYLLLTTIVKTNDSLPLDQQLGQSIVHKQLEVCLVLHYLLLMIRFTSHILVVVTLYTGYTSLTRTHSHGTSDTNRTRVCAVFLLFLLSVIILIFTLPIPKIQLIISSYHRYHLCLVQTNVIILKVRFVVCRIVPLTATIVLIVKITHALKMARYNRYRETATNQRADVRMARSTMAIGIAAVCTLTPLYITWIISLASTSPPHSSYPYVVVSLTTNLLTLCNYCSHPYVIIASNADYRQDLRWIFQRCRRFVGHPIDSLEAAENEAYEQEMSSDNDSLRSSANEIA